MSETVKVTGTIGEYGDGERFPLAVRFDVELPLRDLFAAFALTAVVGLGRRFTQDRRHIRLRRRRRNARSPGSFS